MRRREPPADRSVRWRRSRRTTRPIPAARQATDHRFVGAPPCAAVEADRHAEEGLSRKAGHVGPRDRSWASDHDGDERVTERVTTLDLVVSGAHMTGLPLNGQLTERRGRFVRATCTAPSYRLFSLSEGAPSRPGLLRVRDGGAAIAVEVWAMPTSMIGSLLAIIPSPLGLGTIRLEDGSSRHGFLCESVATADVEDITRHGGWRAYLASLG